MLDPRIVDDKPVTDFRDLVLLEFHKKHDRMKGMKQIINLRKRYAHDFSELLERLHATYGEEPLGMWEKTSASSLLHDPVMAGTFGGIRASLATKGVRVRAHQARDQLSLVQVGPRL